MRTADRQSLPDRLLHRFALQSQGFRRFCLRRECERNDFAFDAGRPNVFIAGLARAGSTALLEVLYRSGAFASTTYRMMPFVLAPSIASMVDRLPRAPVAAAERAHGDAIEIDLDSPAALDGLFWSTFLPQDSGCVRAREVPAETLRTYAMFIENLLTGAGAGRYLSKMNQGIDKLAAMAGFFERSVFLLPLRDPLQQASSLQRQHQRFGFLSAYEKKYFAWLEHYEFGSLHRAYCLDESSPGPAYAANELNYWLRQWYEVYAYLSRLTGLYPNLLPVCYEHMARSQTFWQKLSQRLGIELSGTGFVDRNRADLTPADDIDENLLRDCRALYARLAAQDSTEPT